MAEKKSNGAAGSSITIKKYANRRLYNTATSSYVTLDDLCQMVKEGIDFAVYDAKSGDDITRGVLTQIIVEEETRGGGNLLPINFLRQLIAFYGDNMPQMVLPHYLELSMQSFAENQEKMRSYMEGTIGSVFPFGGLEEMGKQNMAMMERAMQMFTPFAGGASDANGDEETDTPEAGEGSDQSAKVEKLQRQLADMQRQLDEITRK